LTTGQPGDAWTAAEAYEAFMGRWSRPLAAEFVKWLSPLPGGHWLDLGTGTGALAVAICGHADPASVVGCDPSAQFVESAVRSSSDPRTAFVVAGAGSIPRRPGGYDAVVTGLALNFLPDPAAAVEEALRAVRIGGSVGAYVWDYTNGMEFLRHFWDAATAIDPLAIPLDEGRRFPICRPGELETLFRSSGAEQVRVGAIGVETRFSDFEDYWRPFTLGAGPAPSYVASLTEEQRLRLKAELIRRLPMHPEGAIQLRAQAWAVCGLRGSSRS
jgi:SAM-dependent methyltransferase